MVAVSTAAKPDEFEHDSPVVGSGNFLADRGYADPDETRVKYLMCNEIAVMADRMGLTQAKVAELAGIAQPDVSRIVNGNVKDYSVWRLMRILNSLGKDVMLEFSDSEHGRGQVFTNFIEPEQEAGCSPSF